MILTLSSCTLMALFGLLIAKQERIEAYVLMLAAYALTVWLTQSQDLLYFTVLSAFLNMMLIGLTYFRRNLCLASEISLKFLYVSLFGFCLFSISLALLIGGEDKLASIFSWVSLLLFLGATPFFNAHVDYLEGAPAFSSVFLLNTTLIGGGSFIATFAASQIEPKLFEVLTYFAAASLLIPAMLALEQQRIGRLVAYLCMTQVGVLLFLALFRVQMLPVFYFHMAIAIPGVLAGLRFWKHSQNSDKNWEDYAGAGRKHPWVGISWLFILSSLAGAPITLGFWLFLELSKAVLETEHTWILVLIWISIFASMVPVTRLAVFMFGKPTHSEMIQLHRPRQTFLILACAFLLIIAKIICFWIPQVYALKIFTF